MKWTNRGAWLAGLLLWCLAGTSWANTYQAIDGIVAVVNDDVILRSELESATHKIALQAQERGARIPPRSVLEQQVLERLISERLQLQAARDAGIEVTEEMVNRALANIAARSGLSLAEMRDVLLADGLDFREFRRQLHDEIAIQQLRDREIRRRIRVTDQEVERFLASAQQQGSDRAEYRLAHILVATPDGASARDIEQARNRAQALLTRLRGGEDFAAVAMSESAGGQALEGGDLGWRSADQLPSLFSERVAEMERGQINGPIPSSGGFHIIQLVDHRGGSERHLVTQVLARHILIRTNEVTSDTDARSRLQQLRGRIQGGGDFATLAQGHSDDKGSAIRGGELGWLSPGDVVPEFEAQISTLPPNGISEPFKTEFGWHIVQVVDRRRHDNTEEVRRNNARQAIGNRKLDEEFELFVRRLRDEAYVEIRLN